MGKHHPNYISTVDLARFLGISVVAICKRIIKGQLKAVKIGRSYVLSRSYIEEQFPNYPRHKISTEDHISVIEAAETLGIHRTTLFRKIKNGQMKAHRVGRHYIIEKSQIFKAKEAPLKYPALIRDHISVMELADLLNSSRKTIHYQIQTGKIKASKIGRHYVIARGDVPSIGQESIQAAEFPAEQYVSVAQVAKTLDISRIAVFKKIKKGQIKARKIGRSYAILESDLREYVSNLKPSDPDREAEE